MVSKDSEDQIQLDSVFDGLKSLIVTHRDLAESAISFCSSLFYEILASQLCTLNLKVSSAIVTNEKWQLKDEDSHYEGIRSPSCRDACYLPLFEFIRFEYLSYARIHSLD
jgi:hypothetical protein